MNNLEQKGESLLNLIETLNNEIALLREQNAYLLNELKPCPSAAYIVPNPNCCYNYNVTGVGYGNSGCNCGNF